MEDWIVEKIERADVAPLEPLLCGVEAATLIIGRSERFIYDAIARGLLKAVKSDGRTLVVVQSLKDYAAGLPPAKGTPRNLTTPPPSRSRLPAEA
jgi:hypothetical protein